MKKDIITEIQLEKLNIVNGNNITISELEKESNKYLFEVLNTFLYTGKEIFEKFKPEDFFGFGFSGLENIVGFENILKYIKNHADNNSDVKFYIGKENIIEINFKDSLKTYQEIKLVDVTKTQYVIELTFKSKRKNLRTKKIKKNRFRFVYSTFSNKVSCRILNE